MRAVDSSYCCIFFFSLLLSSRIQVTEARAAQDTRWVDKTSALNSSTDEEPTADSLVSLPDQLDRVQCDCKNQTDVCTCVLINDNGEVTTYSVDPEIAEQAMALMREEFLLSQRAKMNEAQHFASGDNETYSFLYNNVKTSASSDRRTWPPKEPYKYENVHLGELSGREEPLLHLQTFPASPKVIGTSFLLVNQVTRCAERYFRDDQVTCRKVTSVKQTYIHYENITKVHRSLDRCDIMYINIHGFRSSQVDDVYVSLRKNQLSLHKENVDESMCILLVDWREGAASQGVYYYAPAAANTVTVGREVALLTYYLILLDKVEATDVHMIGFSLGAQVTHFASVWLRNLTSNDVGTRLYMDDWQIGRITGLDPAARDFSSYNGSHLEREDAAFVDVIHTSIVEADGGVRDVLAGRFGMSEAIGAIDFYPNGGTSSQPECSRGPSEVCSHNRAIVYFTDSMDLSLDETLFRSVPCDSYEHLSKCEQLFLSNSTSNLSRQAKLRAISSMGIRSIQFGGRGSHYLNYLARKERSSGEAREDVDDYDWDY